MMKSTSWNKVTPERIISQHQLSHQIISIIPSASSNSRLQPLNLPCRDLLDGKGEEYNEICLPLYKAAICGNLEDARVILDGHPQVIRFSLTENNDTLLHIAVLGGSKPFVNYLMSIMTKEDLELQNKNGETALCIAAITGNVEIATILVAENERLPHIPDNEGKMPLYMAALYRKEAMVKFLYEASLKMTREFWTQENRGAVLVKCVEANLFDVASKMVNEHGELVGNRSVLGLLARKPEAFYVTRPGIIKRFISSFFAVCRWKITFPDEESPAMQLLKTILNEMGKLPKDEFDEIVKGPPDETNNDAEKIVYLKDTQEALHLLRAISENVAKMPAKFFSLFRTQPADEKPVISEDITPKYSSQVLFIAAEVGNTAFVVEVIQKYPHLILQVNDNNQSIFHVAVSYGHEGIYKLLYEIGPSKDMLIALEDRNGNNMLHIVGEKAKNNQVQNIRGVGLRLNPEIFWFKEIEQMIPPHLRHKKNAEGLTPHRIFIKNHKDEFLNGEAWMKDIATQLMVVAALVATTSYQVAFAPPGGYNQNSGRPMFLSISQFSAFIIFDCVSFIFSTTSILMVLSILGSNYEEYDFMISLSKQLVICLGALFISIASMIVTFLMNYFIVYGDRFNWTPVIISICATTPFLIFYMSKYDLPGRFIRGTRKLYETNISTRKLHLK